VFEIKIDANLSLKLLTLKDSGDLFKLVSKNKDHLKKWMPWVKTSKKVTDTENFIRMALVNFANNKGPQCGVMIQGKLGGIVGLHPIDSVNKKTLLGYWLGREYTGYGIMTECCRTLIDYAFKEFEINKISIRAGMNNVKSKAIPERLGFSHEGILRENEWVDNRFVDHTVYSLLRSEWNVSEIRKEKISMKK